MVASIGVTLPPSIAAKMWEPPGAQARVIDLSFWDYMRAEELPLARPRRDGLDEGTAHNYYRCLRALYRDLGYDLPARATPGALVDPPWEREAPPWERIYRWRDSPEKGGAARLEAHRKALVWLSSYWNLNGPERPMFIQQGWDTKKATYRAKQAGTMLSRERFLHLPDEISRLLAARPFETQLRGSRQWNDMSGRKSSRYLDDLWRVLIFVGFYCGPRPGEFATLRIQNYDPRQGVIRGWAQPKKHGETRDVSVPEDFVFHSRVDPSLDWYLARVRPRVSKDTEPRGAFFLNSLGRPYTETTIRSFISAGMLRALAQDSCGPHSLRRACATWRYHHGWDEEEIARLLGDKPHVIRQSYLDWTWLNKVGRQNARTNTRTPPVALVRSNGTTNSRKTQNTSENDPVSSTHPEKGGC